MTVVARASDYLPAERLEYWRTTLSDAFVPLNPVPLSSADEALEGTMRHLALGDVQVADISGSAQLVHRDRALIRRQDPGWVKVGLQLRGRGVLRQCGREAVLLPGDFAAFITDEPYSLYFDDAFRMLVVMCPRTALPLAADKLGRVAAIPVSGRGGVGALVSPFLAGIGAMMSSPAPPMSLAASQHLANSVLDMVTAGLTEAGTDASALVRIAAPSTLLHQIQGYIEANLHRADLRPPAIAARHHISVRYQQKIFEATGTTVGGWIRERRLERCRRDLADPRLAEVPVSAVAARWGLVDPAYFSRIFRTAYGLTPTEYRRANSPAS
jgi:AraC-like DNA-binding protein